MYLWQLCCAPSLPVYTQRVCAMYVVCVCCWDVVNWPSLPSHPSPCPIWPSCHTAPNLLLHVPFPPSYLPFLSTSFLFFASCLLPISLLCSSYSSKSFSPSSLFLTPTPLLFLSPCLEAHASMPCVYVCMFVCVPPYAYVYMSCMLILCPS